MTGRIWLHRARLAALAAAVAVLAACGSQAHQPTVASQKHAGCPSHVNCKVALIISDAGLGDKGFNDLGYAGLKRAMKEFGVTGRPVQDPQIDTHCTQDLTSAAQAGYGLIVNLNYGCEAALQPVAQQ